jgi:serine/threonine protein phosphatase 1
LQSQITINTSGEPVGAAFQMTERCIAIGDIHGCAGALRALIEAISPQPGDVIVTLGDVIDRGPNSREVLEQLLELKLHCTLKCVMGNHEEMFLAVMRGQSAPHKWIQFGGASTLDSYGFDGDLSVIPAEHVDFISSFEDYVVTDGHFYVHANYQADLQLEQQKPLWLRWISLDQSVPSPHISGRVAIVGHTPDKSGEIMTLRHLKCIDTYCYGGKWLSALDVANGQLWQASDEGVMRTTVQQ